jgi:hypothetical protein
MARSAQMLLYGIGFVADTMILIVTVVWSDPVWKGLFAAVNGMSYGRAPPLDMSIINVIPGIFYGMLAVMWFALLYCVIMAAINQVDYQYG